MRLNTFRLFHNFLLITMKSLQVIQIIWILIQTLPISSTCQLQLYITLFIPFVLERHNTPAAALIETILSTRSGHDQACRLVGCGGRHIRSYRTLSSGVEFWRCIFKQPSQRFSENHFWSSWNAPEANWGSIAASGGFGDAGNWRRGTPGLVTCFFFVHKILRSFFF